VRGVPKPIADGTEVGRTVGDDAGRYSPLPVFATMRFAWTYPITLAKSWLAMKFIEMTGRVLAQIVSDDELHKDSLQDAGVTDDTVVRVNEQGDIEVRRPTGWDVIGGLLGKFEERVRHTTGMEYV
jgi:hypothetical protein